MTDNLLDFEIGMFFSCIVVEECFQLIDEIVFLVRYLQVGHDDVIGGVGPVVVC